MNDISQVENLNKSLGKKLENQEMPFILYGSDDGKLRVKVLVQDDTIWLSQKSMAELFQTTHKNISMHLKNIYYEAELIESATIQDFWIVQNEGARSVRRTVQSYNLDAIIAVGYRVNSKRATQFRIWATQVLKEYIKKWFVLDDDRLKQGKQVFGQDYFQELLERIRSIRTSERRIYQQITDIFAECSIDYDPKSSSIRSFPLSVIPVKTGIQTFSSGLTRGTNLVHGVWFQVKTWANFILGPSLRWDKHWIPAFARMTPARRMHICDKFLNLYKFWSRNLVELSTAKDFSVIQNEGACSIVSSISHE